MQVLEELKRLLKACRHQESASLREFAHEELEHGRLRLAVSKVRLDHIELVKISEQRV